MEPQKRDKIQAIAATVAVHLVVLLLLWFTLLGNEPVGSGSGVLIQVGLVDEASGMFESDSKQPEQPQTELPRENDDELITQEIALYKISSKIVRESGMVDMIIRSWNARIIEMNPSFVVVEKTGTREEIENLRTELETRKVLLEFTRSGSVVLHRESMENTLNQL